MERRILVYELNEVPWEIIDLYVAARPRSNLARLLPRAMLSTTVDEDPVELMPWRSWPTFHSSLYTPSHNSYDQGQDPATFRGDPLWDVADRAGRRVGLFGVLQSWPPRPFASGGFYVPDSFARTDDTFPTSLRTFQGFNTTMTNENSFAPERRLSVNQLVRVGADLVVRGLTPWSVAMGAEQVFRELVDRRYRSRRAVAQVLVCFDVFWRLHLRHDPHLSIFFTNHVASMMHRFWGDLMPEYPTREPYDPDEVHAGFILTAMDRFDHGLGKMVRWVDGTPGSVLLVASSMGQGPIPYHDMSCTYVLDDSERLLAALEVHGAQMGVAMYPRITLLFADESKAGDAVPAIESARTPLGPLFRDIRAMGCSVSFELGYEHDVADLPREVTWTRQDGNEATADIADLGIVLRQRPGGGNTAQHVPEGIVIAYGDEIDPDASRARVSVLDAAPSILALLGVEPAPTMQGTPGMFLQPAGSPTPPKFDGRL